MPKILLPGRVLPFSALWYLGRRSQVNGGQSCSWLYSEPACCDKAVGDGFPRGVVCP